MKLLAFIFGWWIYHPYSLLIAIILRLKGVKVGHHFYIQGVPYLKIRGQAGNVSIGNNVAIYGDIDLRNRENGQIIVEDDVVIDTNCRFVAANNAVLKLKTGCHIGAYCIFNCGTDVSVGARTLLAGFCYVQSSNHGIRKNQAIRDQPHTYGKISIGSDAWLGGHVSVLPGVEIGDGAVIGAKAVVTKNIPPYTVSTGVPASVSSIRPA